MLCSLVRSAPHKYYSYIYKIFNSQKVENRLLYKTRQNVKPAGSKRAPVKASDTYAYLMVVHDCLFICLQCACHTIPCIPQSPQMKQRKYICVTLWCFISIIGHMAQTPKSLEKTRHGCSNVIGRNMQLTGDWEVWRYCLEGVGVQMSGALWCDWSNRHPSICSVSPARVRRVRSPLILNELRLAMKPRRKKADIWTMEHRNREKEICLDKAKQYANTE